MATFSERLRMLRVKAGLTQEQLAGKLGFSTGAVGNWESGLNMPTRKAMRSIAENLGTTELFLSGESDYDMNSFSEPPVEYSAALPYSKMTAHELEFIFDSRQKELSETNDPQKRRELLGIISEVTSEMQKRIPADIEQQLTKRAIQAADSREIKPEVKK